MNYFTEEQMRENPANRIINDLFKATSYKPPKADVDTSNRKEFEERLNTYASADNCKGSTFSSSVRVKVAAPKSHDYIIVNKHVVTPRDDNGDVEDNSIGFYRAKSYDMAKRFVQCSIKGIIKKLVELSASRQDGYTRIDRVDFEITDDHEEISGGIEYISWSGSKVSDIYYVMHASDIDEKWLEHIEKNTSSIDILKMCQLFNG